MDTKHKTPPTLQLNISTAFVNKPANPNDPAVKALMAKSFSRATICLDELAAHIRAGRAFALGYFDRDYRHGDYWVSSQLLGIDVDECPLDADTIAALPFVRDNALLVYRTPSDTPEKPKTRIVFLLHKAVTDKTRWVTLQVELIHRLAELSIKPDKSCKDPARFFYGSTKPGMLVLGNILSADIEAELFAAKAARDEQKALLRQQNPPRPIAANSSEAERGLNRRWGKALDKLAATTSDRHHATISTAALGWGLLNGGWPITEADIVRDVLNACHSNRYAEKVGENEILRCIHDMSSADKIPLEIFESKTFRRAGVNSEKRVGRGKVDTSRINGAKTANETGLNVHYVSDDLTPAAIAAEKTLLTAAAVGLGKTQAIADYVATLNDEAEVTGVAQFRLLTVALRKALAAMHYEDLDSDHQSMLRLVARLVTSVSSLHKFPQRRGVVIADEIEGVLQFILNSGTFRGVESVAAFQALRDLVTNAQQFIGMDAGLSDITIDLIRQWRGDVTVKRYTSARKLRKVTFLRDKYAAFWTVNKLLRQKLRVYVACTSEVDATDLADLHSGGEYRHIKITRDTSNTPKVQAFIENAHNERDEYDLVIYTSAAGAGVDFSNPVDAHVGIFGKEPLAPEQAIQLYGRVRNARRYYAAVPPVNEPYPTPTAEKLKADRLIREQWTAHQNGIDASAGDYLLMLDLWAQFQERALRESAQWRLYFAQRLQANGFTVQVNEARAPIAFVDQVKAWKVERAESDWTFVQAATGQALSDEILDTLRMRGQEITRDLKLRNIRSKIESALHHEHVTLDDRDLMQYKGRKRLSWLTDLFTDIGDLLAVDLSQSAEGAPIQKRKYRALNISVVSALLKMAGFGGKTPEAQFMGFIEYFSTERPHDEINERFAAWITSPGVKKFEALGHRDNNARTARGLCRFFCDLFGLQLDSLRRGRAEGRYRAYQLNAESTAYRVDRARRATALRQAEACTQNVYIGEKHILGTSGQINRNYTKTPQHTPIDTQKHTVINTSAAYIDAVLQSGRANPVAARELA